ncbi:MAG: NOB1 family endonuclease [Thermoplasmatota archaeon]
MASRLVLDASALLAGKTFVTANRELYTPSLVLKEIERAGRDRRALEYMIEVGLRVLDPAPPAVTRARRAAEGTGDHTKLSETDIAVLALASELGAQLATDDYAMQNTAAVLGLAYLTVGQRGITEVFTYTFRCRGCRKTFDHAVKECDVCGSEVASVRAK